MQECNEFLISQIIKNLSIKVDFVLPPKPFVVKYWELPSVAVLYYGNRRLLLNYYLHTQICTKRLQRLTVPNFFLFLYIERCGTKHIRGA